ncbi:lipoamide acyltransferase component of branched-chain alpha-keto acid dehydrogenase complex, mitochondrial-like isoform X2 [Oscarella lobularis]|uniref:lipoamide acyltransferase component of branched-chain alpha-keto acid dehydrogenase complex, mitochondrial-like isoform X2 n=1 Tax=Oscarella lobularis TaxID=121494 RepID=UPI0033137C07
MLATILWRRFTSASFYHTRKTRLGVQNLCRPKARLQEKIPHASWRHFHAASALQNRTIPFLLSDIGEGIAEVTVKEWHVKVGDTVKQFDNVCEVQSDKATVTITSRYDGTIRKIYYGEDDAAIVGKPLVDIELESDATEANDEFVPQSPEEETKESTIPLPPSSKVLATPAVRRVAKEQGIDLTKVTGTGKGGRILKEDVIGFTAAKPKPKAPVKLPTTPTLPEDRVESVKGFKKAMVKTMTLANRIPHFGYADEIVLDGLVALRRALNADAERVRLSYMPFFIKAASAALTQFPILNSHPNDDCTEIVFRASHNVGVAVDTSDGLIVPNIKSVQSLSIYEIAAELTRLRELATRGQLGTDDLSGGTFTLSNIGMIGGTYLQPVILPPEVCIGAIGRIQLLPRFGPQGEVQPTHVMRINWSADHRVIDGATVARFSNLWKSYLEEPGRLLADLR